LTVVNRGPAEATGVRVTDSVPRSRADVLSVRPSQGTCARGRPTACILGSIASGSRATIRLRVRSKRTGYLTNAARVISDVADPAGANNRDEARTRIRAGRTGVTLHKTPSSQTVRSNKLLRYRIRLRSTGPATAHDVRVCDLAPATLAVGRAPGARFRRGRPCWIVHELPAGGRRTFRLTARATVDSGTITNTATVRGANVARRRARATVRIQPAGAGRCAARACSPPALR
jgi:uncharacterized repeat protein (TIGR01451 family)